MGSRTGPQRRGGGDQPSPTKNGHSSEYAYDIAVVGLGYVGLPLVVAATGTGLRVVGIDSDDWKVNSLNKGESYIGDVPNHRLRRSQDLGFVASTDPEALQHAESIIIAVPTPLAGGQPDLSALLDAAEVIGDNLAAGQLVIVESTTYPGTTEEELLPVLEKRSGLIGGKDFGLAYSPERIDPANPIWNIGNTPKLVAGYDDRSLIRARELYEAFCQEVVPVSGIREAEMSKLLENTYRHVNIALINEMSIFCKELDINLWEVIRAASTKPFGFQAFYPGPGVGGHCIPIDPSYLSYRVKQLGYPFRFVELASEINDRMPGYVVQRIGRMLNGKSLSVRGSNVLLVGVSYKANTNDTRESPALPIASQLANLGAHIGFIDPLVEVFSPGGVRVTRFTDMVEAGEWCDVAVVLAPHDEFDIDHLVSAADQVFDTRGIVKGKSVEHL